MYLYRHPRETKENKLTSGHIIHTWARLTIIGIIERFTKSLSRPIFHKEDNPAHMTREDRREKDAAVAARHRAEGGTRYWLDK